MGTNIFLPFSLKALSSRWWFRISKGGIWTVSSLEGISHSYRRFIHQFFLKWRTWLNKWFSNRLVVRSLGNAWKTMTEDEQGIGFTTNQWSTIHPPVINHQRRGNGLANTRWSTKCFSGPFWMVFFGAKKQTCQKQISNPVPRQNNQKFNEIHQLKDILVFFGMEHPSKRIFFKTGPQGKSEVLLAPFLFKNSSLDRGVLEDSEAEDSGKFL